MEPRKLLMEADTKYLQGRKVPGIWLTPETAAVVESIAKKYESGAGKRDGWEHPSLPWGRILETALTAPHTLREAHGPSAFGQLMRAGVQMVANSWYRRYPVTYPKIAQEVASDKRQEFYAPLFGSARPQEVRSGTPFREQNVKGQDIEIIHRKFGAIEAFERELFDDDQTRQIAERARNLGDSMAMWEDQYFSRRFVGAASTDFPPTTIAASGWTGETADGTAITTPFSSVMFKATGDTDTVGNRPASFAQFNYNSLLTAFQFLRRAKDPLGQAMVVVPDTLLVSTFDEINARMATQSPAFPAVTGRTGETVANAAAGFFRGPFGMNPVQGEFQLVVNIHLKPGVWSLGQGGRGFVFQRRDPLEVAQELPLSGDSFLLDVYRFRSRARWEQDWIDPRFWFLGNDGSASLTQ